MRPLTFGSVCSGIEAASVAWHPLGWRTGFVSEIDKHASAVLRHHFPDTPNHGDFTTITKDHDGTAIDLLVGGTPCQAFSIAGLRKGLDDERGNLSLEFLRLADRLGPEWVVWENVPGVLSIDGGRAFGSILGGLAELGYGTAYRVLDAQHFGVPQRRRRVFVVGYLGDWRRAAAVLFERASLSGHPPPRREEGPGAPGWTESGFSRWRGGCRTLRAEGGSVGHGSETMVTDGDVAPSLPASLSQGVGHNKDSFIVARGPLPFDTTQITHPANRSNPRAGDPCHPLAAGAHAPAIAFNWQSGGDCRQNPSASGTDALSASQTPAVAIQNDAFGGRSGEASDGKSHPGLGVAQPGAPMYTLDASRPHGVAAPIPIKSADSASAADYRGQDGYGEPDGPAFTLQTGTRPPVLSPMSVRRLTPTECERLQGFPDGWTATGDYGAGPVDVSDTQRYKMCGNSMAVPVMRWIGERINLIRGLDAEAPR